MIFDSHAHYDDNRFGGGRDELIDHIINNTDVRYIMNVGADIDSSRESIKLAEKYDSFYAAAGIHPHETEKVNAENNDDRILNEIAEMLSLDKVKALGEIGLDYYYDNSFRDIQLKWFQLQMELAASLKCPVIVHDREAHGACLDMVKKYPDVKGIFHSYSGSREMAAELFDLGWYFSFSGVITYKNASRIAEVVKYIPDDRILAETDCPYLSPVPMRGKTNNSEYIQYTIKKMAELRNTTYESMCAVTFNNALKVYEVD